MDRYITDNNQRPLVKNNKSKSLIPQHYHKEEIKPVEKKSFKHHEHYKTICPNLQKKLITRFYFILVDKSIHLKNLEIASMPGFYFPETFLQVVE